MSNFRKTENVTASNEKKSLVIKKIDTWAKTFQNEYSTDFANKIAISNILYSPVDIIFVNTMFETRDIVKTSVPVNNNRNSENQRYSGNGDVDIKLWDLRLNNAPLEYKFDNYSHPLPEYSYVEACSYCRGAGNNACETCGGKGMERCKSCNGTGYSTCTSCSGIGSKNCIYCYGIGYHNKTNPTTGNYEKVECVYCLGLRTTKCTSCSGGKVSCSRCHGSSTIKCDSCNGVGKIGCKSCEGSGKLLWSTSVQQNFLVFENKSFYVFPEIRKHFNYILPTINDNNKKAINKVNEFENRGQINIPQNISFIPDYYLADREYVNMLNNITREESQKCSQGKLLKQKMEFFQSDSYYIFENKQYILLVDMLSENIYAPESPFSEMAEESVMRVKRKIAKKEYGEAMRIAKQAAVLGKGSNIEKEIEALLDNINTNMFDDYKKGVTWGLIINWIIHVLVIFVSDLTKDSVKYTKFLYPSIICILLFIIKFFELKIKKFAYKTIAKYIIDNAIVRILIGGGFATLFVLILILVAK
jgi:hypothetical protein